MSASRVFPSDFGSESSADSLLPADSFQMVASADLAGMTAGAEELQHFLEPFDLDGRADYAVSLVFEELISNIVRCAYGSDQDVPSGSSKSQVGLVEVRVEMSDSSVLMTFSDTGQAFDPVQFVHGDPGADLETAVVGGLGLRMVKAVVEEIHYRRIGDVNQTRVLILRQGSDC